MIKVLIPIKLLFASAMLVFLAAGCNSSTEINNSKTMDNDPNTTILSLSAAFEKKDTEAIKQLINDGYDGFRFSENWTDEEWLKYAEAFKNAKEVPPTSASPSDRERIYQITLDGKPKDIKLTLSDKQIWRLEYSSFIVTPHFN